MPLDSMTFDSKMRYTLNRFSLCNVVPGLFSTGNVRATNSSPSQSRSESCIVINPRNPKNMIGASKKFIDPAIYHFKLGIIYTFDRGVTWGETDLPLKPGWDGMSDPAIAFDDFGNAFLVGGPVKLNRDKIGTDDDLTGLGMTVYRSRNGGVAWEGPIQLTTDTDDDKQWVVCDNHPASPFYGNVYVMWAASSPLRFARSTDHGVTWTGKGTDPPGSSLTSYAFAPEPSVSPDGTLHILWHSPGTTTIWYLRSTDGGASFEPARSVVTEMTSLHGHLPETGRWPHFDYGRFRVVTLVTDCIASDTVLIAAWADMREGRSRIYYRRSLDNGITWEGAVSGQALLPKASYGDTHCFHPQIIATGTGVIGCAFYTFGRELGRYLIRVQLAASWDDGATFPYLITVTEQSWDPLVNAPAVHGKAGIDFIGEYFGLDAGEEHFALLWTDTRTGVQELFSDVVETKKVNCPRLPGLVGEVLAGVTTDGGGWIIVGGKIVKVPPRTPLIETLAALATATSDESAEQLAELRVAELKSAVRSLQAEIKRIAARR